MDFDETAEEAAFRAEARAWLERVSRPRTGELDRLLMGDEDAYLAASKVWQRVLYDAGWAGITWPKAFGGRDGTSVQQAIFNQEQAAREVAHGPLMVGLSMAAPTIIAHGSPAQQDRFLDPMLRGDEVWCQLFSEPGAGSDLAGLATRAVRDGDEWVVDGQKVWTTAAHLSDWGMLLVRTDPDAPKHRGITYLLVDMRSPGVEVRPLRQITGAAHFNEVFLTGVRVPDAHRIGEVDGGWGVAMTTLSNERSAIGGGRAGGDWGVLADLARSQGLAGDPVVRQDLARAFTRFEVLRFLGYRAQTAQRLGVPPGPETSVIKLFLSQHAALLNDLALRLEGPAGTISGEGTARFLNQWSTRIGGGTDQIQRNVIGERSLGLPREPRLDKDVPFRSLPTSTRRDA